MMQSYKKHTISKDTKQSSDDKEGWILQSEKKKRSPSITEETEHSMEENEMEHLMDYKNRYLHVFCMNCGKKGHLTKKCNYPIISLGIVTLHINDISTPFNTILNMCKRIQYQYLFQHDEIQELKKIYDSLMNLTGDQLDEKIKYLMIRRRNSLSYVDFIRGKYDIDDYEYIYNTLLMMTKGEQEDLLSKSFEELWSELWNIPIQSIQYNNEYMDSKQKFQKLREGYMIQKCEIQFPLSMKKIFEISRTMYEEAEWGFPKGRRNIHEKNIECAKREFQEETGLEEREYQIINISPLEEIYLGSNHIRYKHIYYFAQMMEMKDMKIDKKNSFQKSEVGDIRWVTFEEGFSLIRDYHKEKRNILFNTHQFIKNVILHFCSLYQDFYETNKSSFL
jgi:8-oxo-dGTP pyrophosphatase MutT (NUDIX family)